MIKTNASATNVIMNKWCEHLGSHTNENTSQDQCCQNVGFTTFSKITVLTTIGVTTFPKIRLREPWIFNMSKKDVAKTIGFTTFPTIMLLEPLGSQHFSK